MANKLGIYKTVYMVSNWEIGKQFKSVQQEHPETYHAFRRRFHYLLDFGKKMFMLGTAGILIWDLQHESKQY